jgi:hypothetical protein
MNRPNFFIVGAPKCGTTAWYRYLGTHPDIGFAAKKEPHYFNTDMPGFRWVRSEADYLALFENCTGKRAIGEASVQYLASETAAGNIARFAPEARILVFVRDYARYLQSYHNQLVLNCDESLTDFEAAWRAGPDREIPTTCRHAGLLDYRRMGTLSEQIDRYLAHFPPERVMILSFSRWTSDPRSTYLQILSFLGLEDDGRWDFESIHEAKHMSSAMLTRLTQRPPEAALKLARGLRQVLGVGRLGLAGKLRQLNFRKGYGQVSSSQVLEDIAAYFQEDAARLEAQILETSRARGAQTDSGHG